MYVRSIYERIEIMVFFPLFARNRVVRDDRGGLFGSAETVGFLVVTPFHLADRPEVILVNRGWVSKNKINPKVCYID